MVIVQTEFRVLFVCTANLCRSPMAEYLMRQVLTQKWGPELADGWQMRSAGISATENLRVHPYAAAVLAKQGITADDFRTRRLTREDVADADLVLTATRDQRGHVVRLVPTALGRIFTINQLGHLLAKANDQAPADTLAAGYALIEQAEACRALVPPRTAEDDLSDPFGKSRAKFGACAKSLRGSIEQMLRPLPKHVVPSMSSHRSR